MFRGNGEIIVQEKKLLEHKCIKSLGNIQFVAAVSSSWNTKKYKKLTWHVRLFQDVLHFSSGKVNAIQSLRVVDSLKATELLRML